MDVKRRLAVPTAIAWLAFSVPGAAHAGSLDACAQRVIRDWYSGGRVDNLYPLGCYRAAIEALPTDVLEYSDADKDIARALAFARKARAEGSEASEPAKPPVATRPARERPNAPAKDDARPEPSVARQPAPRPAPPETAPVPAVPPRPDSPSATPRRVAAGAEQVEVSAALPYPVIVLAALAATLLSMGAAGWLLTRRC